MPEIASLTTRIAVDTSRMERDLASANRKLADAARVQRQIGQTSADLLSRAFTQSTQRVTRLYDRMTAQIEREAQRQASAQERAQERATASLQREVTRQEAILRRLSATAERESGTLTAVTTGLQNIARAGTVATLALGGLASAGFLAVARAGVDMNVTLERAQMALKRITGSEGGARNLIAALRKESETSSLTFKDLIPIGQQLAAVYGPQGIGKVIPTLRAFGDAATLLGVDEGGLERALLGFRQLLGRDKPQQEELNQVSENLPGFDLRGLLKRRFGTADTEALGKAGVTGQMVGAAIVAGMQQAFGGAQLRAAGNIPTLLSNISDAFNNLTAAVTERFTPQLTVALQRFMQFFTALANNQKVLAALAVPFELVGGLLDRLSAKLPELGKWIERVFTRENLVSGLAQMGGVLLTVFDLGARGVAAFRAGMQWIQQFGPVIWNQMLQHIRPLGDWLQRVAATLRDIAGSLQRISSFGGGGGGGGGGTGLPSLQTMAPAPVQAGQGITWKDLQGANDWSKWLNARTRDFSRNLGARSQGGLFPAADAQLSGQLYGPPDPRRRGNARQFGPAIPNLFDTLAAASRGRTVTPYADTLQGMLAANTARVQRWLTGLLGPSAPETPGDESPGMLLYGGRQRTPGRIVSQQYVGRMASLQERLVHAGTYGDWFRAQRAGAGEPIGVGGAAGGGITVNLAPQISGDIFRDPTARQALYDEIGKALDSYARRANPAPYGY